MAFASLADLKRQRTDFSSLAKSVGSLASGNQGNQKDERFWSPEIDKVGNGQAVIRFLPAPRGEDFPWVQVYSHGYKNEANNQWYIEDCPSTIGQPCPMCEKNSQLWGTGSQENQDLVRKRKRKLHYIANVLIVNDPKHPENNGTVRLYKFGKKIFEKINDVLNPKFEGDPSFNPTDFWEGANFNLRICKVDGFPNYDRSSFANQTEIADTDEAIEAFWAQQHSLADFKDPSKFKTYDELQKRLDKVLGNAAPIQSAAQQADAEFAAYTEQKPVKPVAPVAVKPAATPKPTPAPVASSDDSDSDADYFASLLND